MACLDENQILLLIEGTIPEDERASVEAHLDGCATCRRVVGAAATTRDLSTTVAVTRDARALDRGAAVGRYVVLGLIGSGGMGRVYRAYDPKLDRSVALKLLHGAHRADGAERLVAREARALGKLSHPNVVQVHDVGEHEGDVFVAMELVEGLPLSAWCKSTPRPGFREVLAAYLDAARGLHAAHEKGLVHRDVKPSNILRGDDGRVRVADFGLAAIREATPPEGAPAGAGAARDAQITATGALVGTPLYMAPEQHEGARATVRSDQYSLCVALYEGLYGAPPFPVVSSAKLLAAKKAGPPAAPPAGTSVPAWVHAAIARGLAPSPEDRHPSMEALIAALRDDLDARRRARLRTVAVVAMTVIALAGGWAMSGALRDPCAHPERELLGAWDAGVKDRIRAAFLGTGRAHAEGTLVRVIARVDAYGAEWAAMRGEVCSASRGARAPREALALRDACLDRRRGQLRALTTLLAEGPDAQVLDKAVEMAAGLYPLASCADTEALLARVRPPEDPAVRARVAALEPRLDRVEALFGAGKFKEGLALGEPLLAEAAGFPHAPLRAQIQLYVGKLRDGVGDYDGARALHREAAVSAAEGRDDVLALRAWAEMLFEVADRQRRFEEAALIMALGETAVARVQDARALARWADVEGVALSRVSKLAEARRAHERALALREKALGPEHPDTSVSLNNLSIVLCAAGDCWSAKAILERAVEISEKTLGPEHPDTAISLGNLGNALRRVGDYAGARAAHERALAIKEKGLGPEHPSVASSLTNLGNAFHDLGDAARAVSAHERALAIKERFLGPDHPDVSGARVGLGRALILGGRLDAALPLLERALAAREKRFGPTGPELTGSLVGLAELRLARGAPAEAVPILERALALDSPEWKSEVQITLAEALWQSGRDRARARDLVEKARAAWASARHQPGIDRATRWLAEHPTGDTR
ncbi:MAG: tetratricopeptide repeat protein [Minicystis sp.]